MNEPTYLFSNTHTTCRSINQPLIESIENTAEKEIFVDELYKDIYQANQQDRQLYSVSEGDWEQSTNQSVAHSHCGWDDDGESCTETQDNAQGGTWSSKNNIWKTSVSA